MTHVKLLREALGKYAIAKPAINLNALGIGFGSFEEFLILSRAFEDTGVSAYGGAAPLITSKEVLATAAKIAEVEALHSGNIRLQIAALGISVPALDAHDRVPPPAGDAVLHRRPECVGDRSYAERGVCRLLMAAARRERLRVDSSRME